MDTQIKCYFLQSYLERIHMMDYNGNWHFSTLRPTS